jgi:ABC-2 type transport system permease protein
MASSISTDRQTLHRSLPALTLQAVGASLRAKMRERLAYMGGGSILVWVALPIFQLAIAGLIYRGIRPDLLRYSVVGIAASTFIFNSQYYIGEILDGERIRGTLVGLFLAPCPRLSWLTGFALGGLLETTIAAAASVVFGMLVFGVRFHPNWPALAVTFPLFLAALWGLGFVFSAVGLILKRSNDLSNLLSPFIFLLGGIYYPVALLPLWLRYPAEALPLGYGMQAMADAALHDAPITSLGGQLLPLAAFAVALPAVGVLTFAWLERLIRERGELDLY